MKTIIVTTSLVLIAVVGTNIVYGQNNPVVQCVPYSDSYIAIVDLTCDGNNLAISNYVSKGWQIKEAIGGQMYLTK
jgi:hypothetical protein